MIYMGKLTPKEVQFLKEIGVSGDLMNLTPESDEWLKIEEKVADELEYRGLNDVKTYMYMKVRLLFDPPTSSAAIASMEKLISEFEWRLNVAAETCDCS